MKNLFWSGKAYMRKFDLQLFYSELVTPDREDIGEAYIYYSFMDTELYEYRTVSEMSDMGNKSINSLLFNEKITLK